MSTNLLSGTFAKIHGGGVAVLAVITAAVYFGGIEPVLTDNALRRDLESRLAIEKKSASDLTSEIRCKQRDLDAVEREIATDQVRLEQASKVNDRLGKLAHLAAEAGVRIDTVQPEQIRAGKRYGIIPIAVRGEGTYVQCTAFLAMLAQRFRDIGVRSLGMSCNATAANAPVVFSFELAWYVAPSEKMN